MVGEITLGKSVKRDFAGNKQPRPEWLATFDNKHPENTYLVPFVQEHTLFRSLCPLTGQPDSARIEILYVPNSEMVESKSLKEYLQSFQNSGEYHEDVANRIANTLFDLLKPKYLRVFADFVPRGDLAIKPIVEKWENDVITDKIQWLVHSWDLKSK